MDICKKYEFHIKKEGSWFKTWEKTCPLDI